ILINFQHNWGLAKDAWYTKNWFDKIKLWFMPTGWRPEDVSKRFPIEKIDVNNQKKYALNYSFKHKIIALFQFISLNVFIFLFLSSFGDLDVFSRVSYGILITTTIFGFTSLMDGHKWAVIFEITRSVIGLCILLHPSQSMVWSIDTLFALGITVYFSVTLTSTLWIFNKLPQRSIIVQ
ncbi:MAG: sterol desaturase, partial [Flavobacteriaceae bacterium]